MLVRRLGLQDYLQVLTAMQHFTRDRCADTPDELWLVEHPPVYTQGQAGKAEHVLKSNSIPIVQSDRGGQITYHGPGQLIVYVLFDLRRRHLNIRSLVFQLEQVCIDVLASLKLSAHRQCGAPGVYLEQQKIASVGLRVKNGCSYHGIALNVAMDLKPFLDINPCGYQGLSVTDIQHHHTHVNLKAVEERLLTTCLIQLTESC
jgi:lipoyl(octanoyl) transferase